jgi:uncharacterized protein (TIGR04222 family)
MNPFALLIAIPGPTFLWIMAGFTVICLAVAYFWPQADDTVDYPLPSAESLSPLEIARLRGGKSAVFQVAAFELWMRGALREEPAGPWWNSKRGRIRSRGSAGSPGNPVEAEIYKLAVSAQTPHDLFERCRKSHSVKIYIESMVHKLQDLHLLRTPDELRRR